MSDETQAFVFIGAFLGLAIALGRRRGREPPKAAGRLAWGGGVLSYPSLEAGVLALGQTGSGKSSALAVLLLELLKDGCGMYCPSAKPDDLPKLLKLCELAGRKDVVVVGPDGRATVNFLLESMRGRDFASEALLLNSQLTNLTEAITRTGGGQSGGDNGKLFKTNADRLGRSCFLLILLSGQRPSVELLLEVIQSAAASPKCFEKGTPEQARYAKGEAHRLLCLAYEAADKNPVLRGDYAQVAAYFELEFPGTAEKTRSCYVAELVGPLDILAKGLPSLILGSSAPTLDLAACVARNAVVLTGFSVGRDREIASAIHTGIKLLIQQKILARSVAPETKPFCLVLDEFSQTVTSSDAEYCSIQRSSKGPLIAAAQGRETLLLALNGKEEAVDTLVGNFSVKVCAGPQTPATSRFICDMVGSRLGYTASGSSSGGYKTVADLFGGGESTATGGFSQSMLPLLTPSDLASLASGGPRHGSTVGVFVHSAGEVFAGGESFTFTEVRQLGK